MCMLLYELGHGTSTFRRIDGGCYQLYHLITNTLVLVLPINKMLKDDEHSSWNIPITRFDHASAFQEPTEGRAHTIHRAICNDV